MTVCFFEASTELNLAETSPKNSLMYKLLHEKNRFRKDQEKERSILDNDYCLVSHRMYDKVIRMMSSELIILVSKTECILRILLYLDLIILLFFFFFNNMK